MKKIILNTSDVVCNRKQISLKLNVWRDVITCAKHENVTTSKLISYLIDNHIKQNNYRVNEMFEKYLSIKTKVKNDFVNVDFNSIRQITER